MRSVPKARKGWLGQAFFISARPPAIKNQGDTMNYTQDIHDAAACLRQFQSSPRGCSAREIALAAGLSIERCNTLLERLQQAAVIQPGDTQGSFRLVEDVTALHVLHAVWAPQPSAVQVLFETTRSSVSFLERLQCGLWPRG
jgi:hypothetical protein